MATVLASDADLLERVEAYLADTGMKPTTFGRRAIGDANLVAALRDGSRNPTFKTARKVLDFIDGLDAANDPVAPTPTPALADEQVRAA